MIDYIQWLLESADEDVGETLQWRSWSTVGRGRKTGLDLTAQREEEGRAPLLSEAEMGRRQKTVGGNPENKYESMRETPLIALGGENFLSPGRRESRRGALGEMRAEKAAPGESLYAAAMGARRLAWFVAAQKPGGHGGTREDSPKPQGTFDFRSLDLAFQRDARRYDGGFSLL